MSVQLHIEPEYEAALAQAGLTDFEAFMAAPAEGPAASRHRHRETVPITLRVAGRAQACFLKRTFRVPTKHLLSHLRRGQRPAAQPVREWRVLGELSHFGIPAMRRIAAGERRVAGRPVAGFLLVEAVPMRWTVADWLSPRAGAELLPRARHGLLWALGELLGRLRALNLGWPDAHPRHVFAEPDGAGWRLALIDVERVGPQSAEVDDVARELPRWLRRCLPFEPTRVDQLAFLAGWRATGASLPPRSLEAAELLAAGNRVVALAGVPESWVQGLEPGESGCWINPVDRDALRAAGLDQAGRLLAGAAGERLDKSGLERHRSRWRVALPGEGGGVRRYYLKRFERPPTGQQVRRIMSGRGQDSSAWRESHFVRRLSEAGVPTMRVAALAAEMLGAWERRSALLVAEVPGESLERWLPRHWAGLSRGQRRALVDQVAAVVRVMHKAGLFHRDLYLSHLFVSADDEGRARLHVIDVARMLERPWRPERWRVKDLAALHHSTPASLVGGTERVRFLRRYFSAYDSPGLRAQRHALLRRIIRLVRRRAERMARHDRRRGRGGG